MSSRRCIATRSHVSPCTVRATQPVDNSINLTTDIQKYHNNNKKRKKKTDVALRFTKLLKLFNK